MQALPVVAEPALMLRSSRDRYQMSSRHQISAIKQFSLYIMAGLYVLAGANHFWHPQFYLAIMPPWIGWHEELNYVSGACEILFGLLLIPQPTRRIAAWLLILLLIAIFPANIQMMLNYLHEGRPGLWIAIVRLPLQILLIWWAYGFTRQNN